MTEGKGSKAAQRPTPEAPSTQERWQASWGMPVAQAVSGSTNRGVAAPTRAPLPTGSTSYPELHHISGGNVVEGCKCQGEVGQSTWGPGRG